MGPKPSSPRSFAVSFTSGRGRPALPPRLVAGLLYLQHAFDASDEAVVHTWVENPYWPYFCGEVYLQTEAPIDPSSLTRWRQRVGEEGVETLLMATIEAARRGGVMKAASVDRVIVNTTVMPKAIAHPHRQPPAGEKPPTPGEAGPGERHRAAPELQPHGSQAGRADRAGRYAHAKQFKRMKKALRTLRTRVGRVQREVARQIGELPEQVQAKVDDCDALHAVMCGVGHNLHDSGEAAASLRPDGHRAARAAGFSVVNWHDSSRRTRVKTGLFRADY